MSEKKIIGSGRTTKNPNITQVSISLDKILSSLGLESNVINRMKELILNTESLAVSKKGEAYIKLSILKSKLDQYGNDTVINLNDYVKPNQTA